MNQKAVFFDRDGVINKSIVKNNKPYPPSSISEFVWNGNIIEIIEKLNQKGYKTIIFTNQPDVARGTQSLEKVEEIHDKIKKETLIDEIYSCYHDSQDNCDCRKPKPGMLLSAQKKYGINLKQSYVIGDRWKDIEAGKQVGCKTIFIDYNYDEKISSKPDYTVANINAVERILL